MFIGNFLTFCSSRLIRRSLAFEKYSLSSPPKPDKNGSYLLYIHIPFCEELCPYCSFARVKFEPSLALRYFDALEKEIEIYHKLGYRFNNIYIGGGTPTIMPARLGRIIELAKSLWQIKQISVETNPNHLRPEVLGILKDAGTNRLSVGAQSFNDQILQSIQRLQKYGTGEEIREKLLLVNGMFETLNIDMIFNFPNQTDQMLMQDIETIKEIKTNQVTYYPLMVSKAAKKEIAERCGKVNYRREKQLYKLIVQKLTDQYNEQSVWCFSRTKGAIDEYIIDHDDYVGVGLGSWGYINGTMYSNTFSIPQYINMLGQNKHPIVAYKSFSLPQQIHYDLLIKLLDSDLNLSHMKKKYGNRFWLVLGIELLFLLSIRAIVFRGNSIQLTSRGQCYWLRLMRNFFSIVGDYRDTRTSLDTLSSVQ
ncbi:MAG: coproporphyrinogen III oxidase family protein [Planctomycetota bacterium]|jgi:coproporphyrinogen III oxidase-like Fe-S oxidoreductase